MPEEKVPAELGRLWRLSTGSRLGRPAELDVERVVRAAVELADRDGLSGVTLLKVAQALDVSKMSLYRHVGSKDELFDLMGDFAIGPPPEVSASATDWRAGLRQWALAHRAIYVRRPWLAHLPVSGPPGGPNAIGWMDAMLQVFRSTGLDWATKVGILNLVGGYARHASLLTQQLEKGRRDAGLRQAQVEQGYGKALVSLVDPGRFPEAAKLFGSPLFDAAPERVAGEPGDRDFVFGLELILDGVAAAIDASPGKPPDAT